MPENRRAANPIVGDGSARFGRSCALRQRKTLFRWETA